MCLWFYCIPLPEQCRGEIFLEMTMQKVLRDEGGWERYHLNSKSLMTEASKIVNCQQAAALNPKNWMIIFSFHVTARIFQICYQDSQMKDLDVCLSGQKQLSLGELDRSLNKRSELLTY